MLRQIFTFSDWIMGCLAGKLTILIGSQAGLTKLAYWRQKSNGLEFRALSSEINEIFVMEAIDEEWIRRQVMVERKTHHEISEILKSHLPFNRGLSERSVRRFCENRGIHYRSGLDRRALVSATREAVQKVRSDHIFMDISRILVLRPGFKEYSNSIAHMRGDGGMGDRREL